MPTNQFVNTAHPINVILYGSDGNEHGRGMIEGKTLADVHCLTRNGRHYSFSRVAGSNTAYYRECSQPYTVTEF